MMLDLLRDFQPVSLAELDQRARLMRRTDNKYVLDAQQLRSFLQQHQTDYDVLTIDGVQQFHYRNLYLDSPDFDTFRDHNMGRRRRFKIRFRHYHEAQLYFFEVKIKGFRNETLKYRQRTDQSAFEAAQLPESLYQFASRHIQEHYDYPLTYPLLPAMYVDYERITLVGKEQAVRITIDNHIRYRSAEGTQALAADYYVVEVKSALGRSAADRWLRAHRKHPVQRCSKYCMGVNLLAFPDKNTRFRPVLRRQFQHQ
ncbi:MAG TPA: polyphosphate polymerase domain-containing protein [Paenalcaligenes sp.]|nr:polyphosphate polymerase domain-containing protein [Paenalcaligenes sp.]